MHLPFAISSYRKPSKIMKNVIIIVLLLLEFHLTGFSQNVIIKGKITNPSSKNISILIYPFAEKSQSNELLLDENDEFEVKTTLNDIAYLYCLFDEKKEEELELR